jgi:hypothetical protein
MVSTCERRSQGLENACENVVTLIFISWNPLSCWLRQIAALKRAA